MSVLRHMADGASPALGMTYEYYQYIVLTHAFSHSISSLLNVISNAFFRFREASRFTKRPGLVVLMAVLSPVNTISQDFRLVGLAMTSSFRRMIPISGVNLTAHFSFASSFGRVSASCSSPDGGSPLAVWLIK